MTSEQRSNFTTVVLPFIVFTAIWGSTWIVIRDQLGTVPPQWSVAYRFIIAAAAMALLALAKGHGLRLGRGGMLAAMFLGFAQFCIKFNAVYLAERLVYPVEANELFVRMTADEAAALRSQGYDFYDWAQDEVRFVTSWDQDLDAVGKLAAAIGAL